MKKLLPIHPGEVLLEDFMKPLCLSQYRVAMDIGVPPLRISQIVHGKRAISADTALCLARYFGTTAGIWIRLQARYELELARARLGKRIVREVKVLDRASIQAELKRALPGEDSTQPDSALNSDTFEAGVSRQLRRWYTGTAKPPHGVVCRIHILRGRDVSLGSNPS